MTLCRAVLIRYAAAQNDVSRHRWVLLEGGSVGGEKRREPEPSMAESQLVELQNMRVLLEEVRLLARNLAYHRRAKLEARLELVLNELERQIDELRADQG